MPRWGPAALPASARLGLQVQVGQWRTLRLWPWGGLGFSRAEAAASMGSANHGAACWKPRGVWLPGGVRKAAAREVNLSMPAALSGSGSLGPAAGGDGWALLRPGGASARRLVGVIITGGDACMSLAG